jgi:predicted Zn-dependent protease
MINKLSLFSISVMMLVIACTQNPITGRNQLSLVPESQMQQMAVSQYRQFLTENRVVSSTQSKDAEMVKRVGSRIASAVTNYYRGQGLAQELEGYQWEYNLVQSNDVNAWCMPGGKIVVYTGILPVAENEAALAVVVGHEVAHAIAKHGQERMSLNYFKLRKIKKMFEENQRDMEKATSFEQQMDLIKVHKVLKEEEQKITGQLGTVIIK